MLTVPVPDGLESSYAAGFVNPAMSSWMPLSGRASVPDGGTVLVLGATGTSGQLAVRIALHFGAARVIAVARSESKLALLPTDPRIIPVPLNAELGSSLRHAAPHGIDIVLDYLWGAVAEQVIPTLRLQNLNTLATPTTYVQIGSVAGQSAEIPSAALRSMPLTLIGSGFGSFDPRKLMAEIPKMLNFALENQDALSFKVCDLSDVEREWNSAERLVFTMNG